MHREQVMHLLDAKFQLINLVFVKFHVQNNTTFWWHFYSLELFRAEAENLSFKIFYWGGFVILLAFNGKVLLSD